MSKHLPSTFHLLSTEPFSRLWTWTFGCCVGACPLHLLKKQLVSPNRSGLHLQTQSLSSGFNICRWTLMIAQQCSSFHLFLVRKTLLIAFKCEFLLCSLVMNPTAGGTWKWQKTHSSIREHHFGSLLVRFLYLLGWWHPSTICRSLYNNSVCTVQIIVGMAWKIHYKLFITVRSTTTL